MSVVVSMILQLAWLCVCVLRASDATVDVDDPAQMIGLDSHERAKILQELLRKKLSLSVPDPLPSNSPGEEVSTPGEEQSSPQAAARARGPAGAGEQEAAVQRGGFRTLSVRPPAARARAAPPEPASTTAAPLATPERRDRPLPSDKIDKLMSFLDKNQHRVKDFMRTVKSDPPPEEEDSDSDSAGALPPGLRSGGAAGGRGRPGALPPGLRAGGAAGGRGRPGALQLDMAPAKGGRVHALRAKNRLCHRHVLVPEGPKYDSRGHVYLGAHAGPGKARAGPAGSRAGPAVPAYPATRRPRLLLPRCCNCCKKSLLGCE